MPDDRVRVLTPSATRRSTRAVRPPDRGPCPGCASGWCRANTAYRLVHGEGDRLRASCATCTGALRRSVASMGWGRSLGARPTVSRELRRCWSSRGRHADRGAPDAAAGAGGARLGHDPAGLLQSIARHAAEVDPCRGQKTGLSSTTGVALASALALQRKNVSTFTATPRLLDRRGSAAPSSGHGGPTAPGARAGRAGAGGSRPRSRAPRVHAADAFEFLDSRARTQDMEPGGGRFHRARAKQVQRGLRRCAAIGQLTSDACACCRRRSVPRRLVLEPRAAHAFLGRSAKSAGSRAQPAAESTAGGQARHPAPLGFPEGDYLKVAAAAGWWTETR